MKNILIICLLTLSLFSCRRTKLTTTHYEKSDSTAVNKSVQKDTVIKTVKETIRDTVYSEITIKAPCDSNGKLKEGFSQVFNNGDYSVEVRIENNEIKVKFLSRKRTERNQSEYHKSDKSDTAVIQSNKSTVSSSHKETEKGTGFWDQLKLYLSYISTIVLSIIAWELFLKRLLKLIKII